MAESVIDRVRAELALLRDELSVAVLVGDLSKARALVVSALGRVDGVIGHLATFVEAEVEKVEEFVKGAPTDADEDTDDED